jgi:hypothetical protein
MKYQQSFGKWSMSAVRVNATNLPNLGGDQRAFQKAADCLRES